MERQELKEIYDGSDDSNYDCGCDSSCACKGQCDENCNCEGCNSWKVLNNT